MARRYRMTPARREALRRAQMASARKRRGQHRRNIAIAGGVATGLVAVGVAGYASRDYIKHLSRKKYPPAVPLNTQLAHRALPAGRGLTHTHISDTMTRIARFDRGAKVAAEQRPKKRKSAHLKSMRESRKRQKYWLGKKIPKRNRFTRRGYF